MTDQPRKCPYCGVVLSHPYWSHIQEAHPAEYAKNETWITLYKDYRSMGMEKTVCLMVIAELFNSTAENVESYLKQNKAL
jgi:hypothetical protein